MFENLECIVAEIFCVQLVEILTVVVCVLFNFLKFVYTFLEFCDDDMTGIVIWCEAQMSITAFMLSYAS